ncbi:methyl-accepting chemotaxis protein [Desulfobotulus sp.]|jgi:methyl-accepting chemotaxis protein|uniref:methyl-accepting chemotaxis protein n=1 Tax=Desulfobotulus sp. TaxID=1940337 RepID=UPI002A359AF9|nr:methyl-accepting chemotaxis protein [Desulfobotulus sp.]MDY0164412.1 methyl-accepting chemotaxis protein [Desulfobotulus sp.]
MNFLNNLKVGRRMALGFGLLTLTILFLGGMGYVAALRNAQIIDEIAVVRLPSLDAILTMEYELGKVIAAQRTLLNPRNPMEVREEQYAVIAAAREAYRAAMDLYAPLPQTPEESREWQAFLQVFEEWRKVNDAFFNLSRNLDATGILNPDELLGYLQMFRVDHYTLMNQVADFILTGETYEGGGDHTACNFGRWMATFSTSNRNLQAAIQSVQAPHRIFHESALKIPELMAKDNRNEALRVFHEEMQGSAEKVFEGFDVLIDEAFRIQDIQNEMTEMAMVQVLGLQEKALHHLNEVVEINREIARNENMRAQAQASSAKAWTLAALVFALAFALVFGVILTRSIVQPLGQSGRLFKAISSGDMTATVPQDLLARKDELGDMGRQMAEMAASLRGIFTRLNGGVNTLASSSTELSGISEQSAQGAQESSNRAETVAAAAEEMTTSSRAMAEKMARSSGNLNSVASAMEEMTATIAEIAGNTAKANTSTELSVKQAEGFAEVMKKLGAAAQEIGKVTETINGISEQTNLLALNATIEAARAGEAGKGFAVVAGEIKELAGQTARATGDIREKINGIQTASERASADIEGIVKGIQGVNHIVGTIAAAIEEQSSAIREVAANIASASEMVEEANNQSGEMTQVSDEIARDMASVSAAATQVKGASSQVQDTVRELSRLSDEIREMMRRFKV